MLFAYQNQYLINHLVDRNQTLQLARITFKIFVRARTTDHTIIIVHKSEQKNYYNPTMKKIYEKEIIISKFQFKEEKIVL